MALVVRALLCLWLLLLLLRLLLLLLLLLRLGAFAFAPAVGVLRLPVRCWRRAFAPAVAKSRINRNNQTTSLTLTPQQDTPGAGRIGRPGTVDPIDRSHHDDAPQQDTPGAGRIGRPGTVDPIDRSPPRFDRLAYGCMVSLDRSIRCANRPKQGRQGSRRAGVGRRTKKALLGYGPVLLRWSCASHRSIDRLAHRKSTDRDVDRHTSDRSIDRSIASVHLASVNRSIDPSIDRCTIERPSTLIGAVGPPNKKNERRVSPSLIQLVRERTQGWADGRRR